MSKTVRKRGYRGEALYGGVVFRQVEEGVKKRWETGKGETRGKNGCRLSGGGSGTEQGGKDRKKKRCQCRGAIRSNKKSDILMIKTSRRSKQKV